MFFAIRLAKSGYYGGDPEKVLQAPINIILSVLNFETFESDYETEYDKLNRKAE